MFGEFIRRLTEPDPVPLPDGDARLALTALLVRAARADNDYAPEERKRIDRITENRYDLNPEQAKKLRADAEILEAEAPDTVRFTRAVKDAVPYEHRLGVVEALWEVVLTDGARADEENAFLRLVSNLLGVTDADSNIARRRIAKHC